MRGLVLLAVLAAGVEVRGVWNDVREYSPADETLYLSYTRFLLGSGWSAYPRLVVSHVETPAVWPYPSPLRYGYFAISTAACAVAGRCEYRTLAWVSTLSGIAMILLAYVLARRFLDEPTALLAAALTVTSPLQLALGRRALQDEVAGLFGLAAVAAVLWARDDGAPRAVLLRTTVATVLVALALAVKETFVLYYPGLLAAYALGSGRRGARWRDIVLLAAPPLVYFGGFVASAATVSGFFTLGRIVLATETEYGLQYAAGPPDRPLFDLFLLAPIACLVATAALALIVARREEVKAGPQRIAIFLVLLLVPFAFVSKNARYLVAADTVVRILAAWALVSYLLPRRWRALGAAAFATLSGLAELALFHKVFVVGGVYDPVTVNLLRALHAIPR